MNNSARRKTETLGMHPGTAQNRLRKLILFHLVKRVGEDTCFRCGKKIESTDDLTIDHKESWSGKDAKLFWDVENIAFSHHLCNSLGADHHAGAHERGMATAAKTRKVGPEGTSWCTGCQQFLPITEFFKNRSGRNGWHWSCRACESKRHKKGK